MTIAVSTPRIKFLKGTSTWRNGSFRSGTGTISKGDFGTVHGARKQKITRRLSIVVQSAKLCP